MFEILPLSAPALVTYVVACIVLVIVPGPTVTLIVASSLRGGTRAGLANVAGTQAGLLCMLIVLALGLETIMTWLGEVFFWLKYAGAAYLIYLGVNLWRAGGLVSDDIPDGANGRNGTRSLHRCFWQGLVVILSNPKVLLLFGAFIPQFVDPTGNAALQTLILGLIFMVIATLLDSCYAVLAGGAGRLLTRTRVRLVERLSGSFLIGGGIWLALTRRA